jgi:hypothetical protein
LAAFQAKIKNPVARKGEEKRVPLPWACLCDIPRQAKHKLPEMDSWTIDSVTGLGLPFLHGRSRIRHGMGIWESEKTSLRLPTPSPINQFNLINTHLVGDRVLVR